MLLLLTLRINNSLFPPTCATLGDAGVMLGVVALGAGAGTATAALGATEIFRASLHGDCQR